MPDDGAPTEVYIPKSIFVVALVVCVCLTILMAVASRYASGYVRLEGIVRVKAADVFGVLAVLTGAMTAYGVVTKIAQRGPEFVLTGKGLVHRRYGRIDWAEVRYIESYGVRNGVVTERFLVLSLRDPAAFYARSSTRVRGIMNINRVAGYPEIILMRGIGIPTRRILDEIRRHRPELPLHDD